MIHPRDRDPFAQSCTRFCKDNGTTTSLSAIIRPDLTSNFRRFRSMRGRCVRPSAGTGPPCHSHGGDGGQEITGTSSR